MAKLNRDQLETVASVATSDYFEHMYGLLTEFIPRNRLAKAHNHAQKKVLKRARSLEREMVF